MMTKLKVELSAVQNYVGHSLVQHGQRRLWELWKLAVIKDYTNSVNPCVVAEIRLAAKQYRIELARGFPATDALQQLMSEALKGHHHYPLRVQYFPILDDDSSWRDHA